MDKTRQRERLEGLLAHLTRRTEKVASDRTRASGPLDPDFEEQAVLRENDEVLDELAREGHHQIGLLKEALRRLDDGTYGACADCGEAIGEVRLEALPYAVTCVACAERRERDETSGP